MNETSRMKEEEALHCREIQISCLNNSVVLTSTEVEIDKLDAMIEKAKSM